MLLKKIDGKICLYRMVNQLWLATETIFSAVPARLHIIAKKKALDDVASLVAACSFPFLLEITLGAFMTKKSVIDFHFNCHSTAVPFQLLMLVPSLFHR